MAEFKVAMYQNHEDLQHGHAFDRKVFPSVNEAILYAKHNVYHGEQCSEISCKEHDGFPGTMLSLNIDRNNKGDDLSIEDFWMCPDPNYRGIDYPSSNFYGTVKDFIEKSGETEQSKAMSKAEVGELER